MFIHVNVLRKFQILFCFLRCSPPHPHPHPLVYMSASGRRSSLLSLQREFAPDAMLSQSFLQIITYSGRTNNMLWFKYNLIISHNISAVHYFIFFDFKLNPTGWWWWWWGLCVCVSTLIAFRLDKARVDEWFYINSFAICWVHSTRGMKKLCYMFVMHCLPPPPIPPLLLGA